MAMLSWQRLLSMTHVSRARGRRYSTCCLAKPYCKSEWGCYFAVGGVQGSAAVAQATFKDSVAKLATLSLLYGFFCGWRGFMFSIANQRMVRPLAHISWEDQPLVGVARSLARGPCVLHYLCIAAARAEGAHAIYLKLQADCVFVESWLRELYSHRAVILLHNFSESNPVFPPHTTPASPRARNLHPIHG